LHADAERITGGAEEERPEAHAEPAVSEIGELQLGEFTAAADVPDDQRLLRPAAVHDQPAALGTQIPAVHLGRRRYRPATLAARKLHILSVLPVRSKGKAFSFWSDSQGGLDHTFAGIGRRDMTDLFPRCCFPGRFTRTTGQDEVAAAFQEPQSALRLLD